MIDLHSHILAGLDDGARSLDESLGIARRAVVDGIEVIAATPHVRSDYPTTPAQMEGALVALRKALDEHRIPLDVRPGGEVAIDQLEHLDDEELRRFALAGNPHYLLVEFPYAGWPLTLDGWIFKLRRMGITAVLGHPERNLEVQETPARLEPLVRAGALVQLTASSLDRRAGRKTTATASMLVRQGLAHMLASDAHHAGIREVGLRKAVATIDDRRLARWLVEGVPRAILTGAPLPRRPEKRRSGFFGRRR